MPNPSLHPMHGTGLGLHCFAMRASVHRNGLGVALQGNAEGGGGRALLVASLCLGGVAPHRTGGAPHAMQPQAPARPCIPCIPMGCKGCMERAWGRARSAKRRTRPTERRTPVRPVRPAPVRPVRPAPVGSCEAYEAGAYLRWSRFDVT